MNILIDPRSDQVQVQNETGSRLNTLIAALVDAGYSLSYVNYNAPLAQQLESANLFMVITHLWYDVPGWPPAIPQGTDFSWSSDDLDTIQDWVNQGGSLLLISTHTSFCVNDIPLAAKFGITIVPAFFCLNQNDTLANPLVMTPNTKDWPGLSENVSNVQAWDSCGVSTQTGDVSVILPFPPGTYDATPQNYYVYNYAFAVAKTYGYGGVVVAGHGGIVGDNYGTPYPSPGQIDSGDTKQFLLNCVSYLGSGQRPATR